MRVSRYSKARAMGFSKFRDGKGKASELGNGPLHRSASAEAAFI